MPKSKRRAKRPVSRNDVPGLAFLLMRAATGRQSGRRWGEFPKGCGFFPLLPVAGAQQRNHHLYLWVAADLQDSPAWPVPEAPLETQDQSQSLRNTRAQATSLNWHIANHNDAPLLPMATGKWQLGTALQKAPTSTPYR